MNDANNLFASLTDEEIAAYTAGNEEEEPHIVIGSDRSITVPETLKRLAVQHDHNVETVTFDMPRYWDSVDFYGCPHTNTTVNYVANGGGTHTRITSCSDCGVEISRVTEDCVGHDNTTVSHVSNGDGTHTRTTTCGVCDGVTSVIEKCNPNRTTAVYSDNRNGTHACVAICNVCKGAVTAYEDCSYDENGICKHCGHQAEFLFRDEEFVTGDIRTDLSDMIMAGVRYTAIIDDGTTIYESTAIPVEQDGELVISFSFNDYQDTFMYNDPLDNGTFGWYLDPGARPITATVSVRIDKYACHHSSTNITRSYNGYDTHKCVEICKDCGEEIRSWVEDCAYDEHGVCVCGHQCTHSSSERAYTNNGDGTHRVTGTCEYCGQVCYDEIVKCVYKNGVCKDCGSTCPHENAAVSYASHGDGTHSYKIVCKDCGVEVASGTEDCTCENGVCACGYRDSTVCTHENAKTAYTNNGNGTHNAVTVCSDCNSTISSVENCTYENGMCKHCGYQCKHESTETTYTDNGNGTHGYVTVCDLCGKTVASGTEACTYENGVCALCGNQCKHTNTETTYTSNGDGTHSYVTVCKDCGKTIAAGTEGCTITDGKCEHCSYQCKHENKTTTYTDNGNGTHGYVTVCDLCGKTVASGTESCTYENGVCKHCGYVCKHETTDENGVCTLCGNQCKHENTETTYTNNNDGTHSYVTVCEDCGIEIASGTAGCTYENGVCTLCGYECKHESKTTTYTNNGNGTHGYVTVCDLCGKTVASGTESCTIADGNCKHCGQQCLHANTETIYTYNGTGYYDKHDYVTICKDCNKIVASGTEDCAYENGTCTICGHKCEHDNTQIIHSVNADGTHNYVTVCKDCGIIVTSTGTCPHPGIEYSYTNIDKGAHRFTGSCKSCGETVSGVERCDYDDNGICKHCGYAKTDCSHANQAWSYVSNGDGTHCSVVRCTDCGEILGVYPNTYNCVYWSNGVCKACGYSKYGAICEHTNAVVSYISNGDGTHNYTGYCPDCGETVAEKELCEYDDNGICKHCGYAKKNCSHSNVATWDMMYISNGDGTHNAVVRCNDCGEAINYYSIQDCDMYYDENSVCQHCGHHCTHPIVKTSYTYAGGGKHGYVVVCKHCKNTVTYIEEACEYDENGVCIHCGSKRIGADNGGGFYAGPNPLVIDSREYMSMSFDLIGLVPGRKYVISFGSSGTCTNPTLDFDMEFRWGKVDIYSKVSGEIPNRITTVTDQWVPFEFTCPEADQVYLTFHSARTQGIVNTQTYSNITVTESGASTATASTFSRMRSAASVMPVQEDTEEMRTKFYINYMLADGTTGSDVAKNVRISSEDPNLIQFDWTIQNHFTQASGGLQFLVCVKNVDDDGTDQHHWNSELCKDCYVSPGMECGPSDAVEMYPDVVTQVLIAADRINSSNLGSDLARLETLEGKTVEMRNALETLKETSANTIQSILTEVSERTREDSALGKRLTAAEADIDELQEDIKLATGGTNKILDSALYNLGAFDTVTDNEDGTVTITRQTGYVCFDGVNVKLTNKSSGKKSFYTEAMRPYISCPNSQAAKAEIVSSYLQAKSNTDVYHGVQGISVWHENEPNHPKLCGSIHVVLPGTTDDTTVDEANALLSKNPLYVQYKRKTSYTEKVSKQNPVSTLDQQGEQWIRSEWEKGLNLCNTPEVEVVASGKRWVFTPVTVTLPTSGTYTVSAKTTSTNAFTAYIEVHTDPNWDQTKRLYKGQLGDGVTFTTDKSTVYILFYASGATEIENTQTYTNIMVNEGNRAYPYVPYSGKIARENGNYPGMTVGKLDLSGTKATAIPSNGVWLVRAIVSNDDEDFGHYSYEAIVRKENSNYINNVVLDMGFTASDWDQNENQTCETHFLTLGVNSETGKLSMCKFTKEDGYWFNGEWHAPTRTDNEVSGTFYITQLG